MEWVMPCSAVGIAPYRGMILPSLDLGQCAVCKTGSVSTCLVWLSVPLELPVPSFAQYRPNSVCVWCIVVKTQLWLPSYEAPSPPLHFLDSRHHLGQFRNPWLGWRLLKMDWNHEIPILSQKYETILEWGLVKVFVGKHSANEAQVG